MSCLKMTRVRFVPGKNTVEMGDNLFTQCTQLTDVTLHIWSPNWSNDGTYHWHNCSANDCSATVNNAKDGYGKHNYNGKTCIVCGYTKPGTTGGNQNTNPGTSGEDPNTNPGTTSGDQNSNPETPSQVQGGVTNWNSDNSESLSYEQMNSVSVIPNQEYNWSTDWSYNELAALNSEQMNNSSATNALLAAGAAILTGLGTLGVLIKRKR